MEARVWWPSEEGGCALYSGKLVQEGFHGEDPGKVDRRSNVVRICPALAALAAFAAFAFAAPAHAAIYNLSTDTHAEKPDIAVDDAGTAHVAWTVAGESVTESTLVYCRIPRGAKGCAATQAFPLPGSLGKQWVNVRGNEVIVTAERCCFPSDRLYMVASNDGGLSFSAPQVIAETFYGWGEEVELGPGDFSLSAAGGGGGCNDGINYSAIPLSGLTTTWADLTGSCFQGELYASIGFPDPLTPLVAYSDWSTPHILFRRWSGSGVYNDPASWEPVVQVPGPGGGEPKLASGVRGVYLMYEGTKPPYQEHVRRYDGTNFPSSSDKIVSDPGTEDSAIFRDIFEDGGGNLHAVFLQDDETRKRALRQSVSTNGGKRWQLSSLVRGAAAENIYNLRVGAASDGGGAIVGDHNSEGPIWFAPFAPLGSGAGGSCAPSVKIGGARAQALQGCFKRNGDKWVASGPVKLNGIDIEPLGGSSKASASAAFHVTANPGQRTLTTSATANVRAGNVLLDRGLVDWKLPEGDGKVVRLGSPDGTAFRDLGKFAKSLFGFPVDGDAELLISGSGTKIPTHLRMPDLIGGVTGDTTLRTTLSGLALGGLKVDVSTAAIGSGFAALRIGGIDVSYDGQDTFTGTASISLPPAYAQSIGEVQFGFENGELSLLKVTPPPFNPTLPIIGSPPTPIVGLDRVAFSYLRKPDSRIFQGDVFLLGGPKPAGLRAVSVDGAVTLEFPTSKPTTLKASGNLQVVRVPLGSASATYTVPSTFEFGGSFGVLSVSGSVNGFVDLAHKSFSASGSASVGPLSGEAVISNDGFGACVDNPFGPDPGISWEWGDIAPEPGCPGSSLLGLRTSAARASRAGVEIPPGSREGMITVRGVGGAPKVVVTTPDGKRISGGAKASGSGRFRVTSVPASSRTYVQIDSPAGGAYQVRAEPGSVPIAAVRASRSAPPPRVKASVRGAGRRRSLHFHLRHIEGQQVTFAEQSGHVYREIGSTRKARGSFRFHPAPGPRGKRSIVAIVEQNGVPRAKLTVAHYKAPPTRRLRPPRRAVAKRQGGRLVVGWTPVEGARGYEVRVNLPRDGRRLLFFARSKRQRLQVRGIERSDTATVTIAAIGPDMRAGHPAKAKLKPAKKKRHGGRHRGRHGP